jgi:hypothetical protein
VPENGSSIWHFCAEKTVHVFGEQPAGSHDGDSFCDDIEQPAFVLRPLSLACTTDGLARPAKGKDSSSQERSELLPWEGVNIRKDRCCIQLSVFHFRNQVAAGKDFPLAVSDTAQVSDNTVESESNAFVSAEK